MKTVKGLLLAGAAGIAAVSGAQAADLPVKARAAEYVKVCSAYGAGFFFIPGTDTCIKIGGYIWMEYAFGNTSSTPFITGAGARDNKADVPEYLSRVRSELSFDTRTQTEYGTLRSFIRFGPELNTDPSGYTGQYTAYRGTIQFSRAFIQFAGFTLGKTQSFFDFYAGALSYTTALYAGSLTGASHNLAAYTMQFGGGFSATVSLEEGMARRTALIWSGAAANPVQAATMGQNGSATTGVETAGYPNFGYYRQNQYPDIVANLRLDQPWGSAQIMGAIHDTSGGCNGACVTGAFGSATGYAVGAGIKFNLPFAAGDELWIQGTYADGATSYLGPYKPVGQDSIAIIRGNASATGAAGTFTHASFADGVINAAGQVEKSKGYQFSVAAQHFWTPGLRTSVFGGYVKLDVSQSLCSAYATPGAATVVVQGGAPIVSPGTAARTGTAGCNPDFNLWQVGTRTVWSPVANLDIGVEVLYTKVDQQHTGNWNGIAGGGNGTGTFRAADEGIWNGSIRVTRNFWP